MSRKAGIVAGCWLLACVGIGRGPGGALASELRLDLDPFRTQPRTEKIYPLDKSQPFYLSLDALRGADSSLRPDDLKLDFDFPLVYHPRIERWLNYFTVGEGREVFARWLARSGRYEEMIRQILREEGLPEDFLYLAMIESGFNPAAYSRARAGGIWQFMPSTGRKYGLSMDWWADERRDPEKSTRAAVQYLSDLYARFGSWHLAAASYNAGEGKIQRAIDTYETEDYWELLDYSFLRNETKDYLPKMIAAAIIAKNPERFGFTDVALEPPVEYETVPVSDATDLRVIARCAGATYQEILRLNPELLRWCTPPGRSWQVRVPKGTAETFQLAYAQVPPSQRVTFRRHVIRQGETLSEIAASYRTGVGAIMQVNGIRNPRTIRTGQSLIIPTPIGSAPAVVASAPRPTPKKSPAPPPVAKNPPPGTKKVVYTIQSGDTLWAISLAYDVTVAQLKSWNGIRNHYELKPGDTVMVYTTQSEPLILASNPPATPPQNSSSITYTVRRGDNLWTIAQRFRLRIEDIQAWNSLERDHILQPGDRLQLFVAKEN